MLSSQEELSKLDLNKTEMDFDSTSLYPSAMWDDIKVYPKIESGFAFEPDMNDVFVETFNNQTFNQDGNESAILRIKYYNPTNVKFQHIPNKGKVRNIEVKKMRIG